MPENPLPFGRGGTGMSRLGTLALVPVHFSTSGGDYPPTRKSLGAAPHPDRLRRHCSVGAF